MTPEPAPSARMAWQLAKQEAERLGHPYIDTLHLLVGILKHNGGLGRVLLERHGVSLGVVRDAIESLDNRSRVMADYLAVIADQDRIAMDRIMALGCVRLRPDPPPDEPTVVDKEPS